MIKKGEETPIATDTLLTKTDKKTTVEAETTTDISLDGNILTRLTNAMIKNGRRKKEIIRSGLPYAITQLTTT